VFWQKKPVTRDLPAPVYLSLAAWRQNALGLAFAVVAGTAVVLTLAPDSAVADWLWQLIA
jgi:hypothetical protein